MSENRLQQCPPQLSLYLLYPSCWSSAGLQFDPSYSACLIPRVAYCQAALRDSKFDADGMMQLRQADCLDAMMLQ